MMRAAKGGLVVTAATWALTAASGSVYHASATRADRRRYPPPGVLVDIGGYRLHLDVRGASSSGPTVILEAGFGSFSPNWHWVQEDLARSMRTVSYDRAGLGWSDPSPLPRDARSIAVELRNALRQAGIDGLFVLAGHSFGGLPIRMFADLYPEDTAGLVLVDSSHPDQWVRWPTPNADRMIAAGQQFAAVLAWFGLLRAMDLSAPISEGLPDEQVAQLRARSALPGTATTEAAQMRQWPTSREQVNAAGPLGDLPLAVIGVGVQPRGGELLSQLQAELTGLTATSSFRLVPAASHESLVARREHAAVVVSAIRDVVTSAMERRVAS
jgi:pimeloyl-ACP methyl ester carboxylesterase